MTTRSRPPTAGPSRARRLPSASRSGSETPGCPPGPGTTSDTGSPAGSLPQALTSWSSLGYSAIPASASRLRLTPVTRELKWPLRWPGSDELDIWTPPERGRRGYRCRWSGRGGRSLVHPPFLPYRETPRGLTRYRGIPTFQRLSPSSETYREGLVLQQPALPGTAAPHEPEGAWRPRLGSGGWPGTPRGARGPRWPGRMVG